MLTIRQQQIDLMMQPRLDDITLTLANEIKQRYPVFFQYYTPNQRQNWVAQQIDYLKQLNIIEKANVEKTIDLLALHGANFERCPDPTWATEILEDAKRNESIRCIALLEANEEYMANRLTNEN